MDDELRQILEGGNPARRILDEMEQENNKEVRKMIDSLKGYSKEDQKKSIALSFSFIDEDILISGFMDEWRRLWIANGGDPDVLPDDFRET